MDIAGIIDSIPAAASALLAVVLTLVGLTCFIAMIWSSRKASFSINRTAVALSGSSRTEVSKPLVYALGAVLCLALAAGLLAYRNLP